MATGNIIKKHLINSSGLLTVRKILLIWPSRMQHLLCCSREGRLQGLLNSTLCCIQWYKGTKGWCHSLRCESQMCKGKHPGHLAAWRLNTRILNLGRSSAKQCPPTASCTCSFQSWILQLVLCLFSIRTTLWPGQQYSWRRLSPTFSGLQSCTKLGSLCHSTWQAEPWGSQKFFLKHHHHD